MVAIARRHGACFLAVALWQKIARHNATAFTYLIGRQVVLVIKMHY